MEGTPTTVRWLPGAARLAPLHRAAGQQLDHLCGVHWGSILLAADGYIVTPEVLAVEAGTLLPAEGADGTPPGVGPRPTVEGALPLAVRPGEAGTSIAGLARAVATISGGGSTLVPLIAEWTARDVMAVVSLCEGRAGWRAVPIANVRTGRLWGSRLPLADALAWVEGADVIAPEPDWDVGHFVTLAGTFEGVARTMVIVRDSYPTFGWDGHHLQPPEALAAGLARDDGRGGGIALHVSAGDRPEVERAAKEAGLGIGHWDNGTPWPMARDERRADR